MTDAKPEWLPMDRLAQMPEDRILAWDGNRVEVAEWDADRRQWWVLAEYTVEPLLWHPIPELPAYAKGGS